ncbi:hypothetical protein I317_06452 [Kwoniella heveanensis CBS 569]|uniref:A-kinase anchor protein 7-like phosphoesterase domain-containing protein n=1 Tax=Kwoniella heveanensis BCC8398 TaxID=1296120 RepID=A0A1B9GMQ8_9TREE|nr:hypothetical protein I316_06178 [Kwoniella heveanensis BCC8398]OCF39728.1 hypothetical protein I317_06452 [Kwoniella heveanensis CBS 569]
MLEASTEKVSEEDDERSQRDPDHSMPVNPLRLLPLCQRLNQTFIQAGFVIDENRPLKLHATVINTRYATKGRDERPISIDSRPYLNAFQDEIWAEGLVLDRVAICKMRANDVLEGGRIIDAYYEEVASVPLMGDGSPSTSSNTDAETVDSQ